MNLVHGAESLKSFMKGRFPWTEQEGSGRGERTAKSFALRDKSWSWYVTVQKYRRASGLD